MAFFGLGKEVKIDTPEKALMLACYTMLFVDETPDDNKITLLENINKSGKELDKSPDYKNAVKFFDKHDFKDCAIAISEELNQDECNSVFVNLVDFALADGDISDEEEALLNLYANALDIDEDLINGTLAVMSIKNYF